MKCFKTTIGLLFLGALSSCAGKCRDYNDSARSQFRDTSLNGVWRYQFGRDSDFVILKPNGDFNQGSNFENSNTWAKGVWFTHDSVIATTYCSNGDIPLAVTEKPGRIDPHWIYILEGDTLLLENLDEHRSIYTPDSIPIKTKYVRVKKY